MGQGERAAYGLLQVDLFAEKCGTEFRKNKDGGLDPSFKRRVFGTEETFLNVEIFDPLEMTGPDRLILTGVHADKFVTGIHLLLIKEDEIIRQKACVLFS